MSINLFITKCESYLKIHGLYCELLLVHSPKHFKVE